MFPRYLEDKIFKIPVYRLKKIKYVNVIVAHEMLHFIFYNYFFIKYPKYKVDKYNLFVWHISEIFNAIIQNSSQWLRIFEIKTMAYPEHKEIIAHIKKKHLKYENVQTDKLIKDIFNAVKSSKLNINI